MAFPVSILDLASIGEGESAAQSFEASVALAQLAERAGYHRVWYAEHHNMASIASSATSVLIAHVAAHTNTIRVGAGGVMLPNHVPLTIAEQFGTLETLHPGRIDLGLGRAPGGDPVTSRALRRDDSSADTFPQDVLELQGYLGDETRVPGVHATPGRGTHVPLYVLGSSLYGAELAALLGLPYAFASHFAPAALHDAVARYRREFRPSDQLAEPYVIAGVNAIVSDDADDAHAQFASALRRRARMMVARVSDGPALSDDEIDAFLETPNGAFVKGMTVYSAVGTPAQAADYLATFKVQADADELIVACHSPSVRQRLRSFELLAGALLTA